MDKEKIKEHFKKNYKAYLVGVASAGITMLLMRSAVAQRGTGEDLNAQRGLINTASHVFSNKQIINLTTVVDREGRGHPGWPVQNVETKRIFLSQREAARAMGVNEGLLSGHLTGKFDDVNGLHFERINLMAS